MAQNSDTNPGPQWPDDRRSVAVVTTTIHVPRFLGDLVQNARRYGHADRLTLVVVADRKTPAEAGEYVVELGRESGVRAVYLDLAAQRCLLRRWPTLEMLLRYDCVQRRNVGYLQAAVDGAEVIITVDDDNFATEDDFLGHHLVVGREVRMPVVAHPSGWWNVCQRLRTDPPRRFYHRGYPKSQQDWSTGGHEVHRRAVRVVANAGLWLGVPDVDATTQLDEPIHVVGLEPIDGSRACALAPGTWSPMNSQNAAYDISVFPAMYLPVMLDPVRGYRIDRMDDIWMAYFLRAIADGRDETVAVGPPLALQKRNFHDGVGDLAKELAGYILTEHVVEFLRSFRAPGGTYRNAYLELIYHLRDAAEASRQLDEPQREYFRQLTIGMAAWHAAVVDIGRS